MKVGIVGLGKMGQIRAQCCQQAGIEIVATCDIDPRQVEHFAHTRFYTDYHALCAQGDVEAIFACAFNNVQARIVTEGLIQGKHVFCEKPPGRYLEDVRLMEIALEQCRQDRDLVLMFGFNHRWRRHVLLGKDTISSGRLGEVLWIRAEYCTDGHTSLWRQIPLLSGGGVTLDLGIHMFDLLHWLTGEEFEIVSALVDSDHVPTPVDDNVFALLRSNTGTSASVHFSVSSQPGYHIEVGLTGGSIKIDGFCSPSKRYSPATFFAIPVDASITNPCAMNSFEDDRSFQTEVDMFRQAVEDGAPGLTASLQDAKRAMQLVHAVQERAEP